MKLFLKVLGIAVILAALFMLGFFLWGERFERLFGRRSGITRTGERRVAPPAF